MVEPGANPSTTYGSKSPKISGRTMTIARLGSTVHRAPTVMLVVAQVQLRKLWVKLRVAQGLERNHLLIPLNPRSNFKPRQDEGIARTGLIGYPVPV